MKPLRLLQILCTLISMLPAPAETNPIVIAHRGASGYLPEHTLEAAAYAHALKADYIEQDVVMTRDDVLIVLHDIHLDTTTDVASQFPSRHRADGRYYAVDFDWTEIRQLTVRERFNPESGQPVFPGRFPHLNATFHICRLDEQLTLIKGLNQSTKHTAGIYPEIKYPAWHHAEGKDVGVALLKMLSDYGYTSTDSPVFVQCFEAEELIRLRKVTATPLKFIQLIGLNSWGHTNVDYDTLLVPAALAKVSTYAQGIGPHLEQVLIGRKPDGAPHFSKLVADAHAAGLAVHPYTLRIDELPDDTPELSDALPVFLQQAEIDGIFTDHPDVVVQWLDNNARHH